MNLQLSVHILASFVVNKEVYIGSKLNINRYFIFLKHEAQLFLVQKEIFYLQSFGYLTSDQRLTEEGVKLLRDSFDDLI